MELGLGAGRVWWSGRAQGDLSGLRPGDVPPAGVAPATVVARVAQVHGPGVVVVDDTPGPGRAGPEGDALVTTRTEVSLVVCTADCGPVALAGAGVHGAVHVGWRGLLAGVLEAGVAEARRLGGPELVAALGPSIGPCCYEFSAADLGPLRRRLGDVAVSATTTGRPALDLPGAVTAVLHGLGVPLDTSRWRCTVCTEGSFSHRRDRTTARQAMVVWRDDR